jgi:hypothetical protein
MKPATYTSGTSNGFKTAAGRLINMADPAVFQACIKASSCITKRAKLTGENSKKELRCRFENEMHFKAEQTEQTL